MSVPSSCPVREIRKTEVFKISDLSITAKNIILQAAQKQPLQGEQSPAAELLYYQARELYELHAKGMITAAIGAERKAKITAAYITNANREQQYVRSNQQAAEFYKSIELASHAYAKSPSIETANALYKSIYNLLPKGA